MKTPMHSIRNKASSKKVSQDMIKVGISKNFIERKKQYENTFSEQDVCDALGLAPIVRLSPSLRISTTFFTLAGHTPFSI